MEPGPDWTARERELWTLIGELRAKIVGLEAEVARLKKNSSNSSKPPSSDIVKPPVAGAASGGGGKRKIGGQPGHVRHERAPLTPDQIDRTQSYTLDRCPDCGGPGSCMERLHGEDRVVQQVEIVVKPVTVTEHRAAAYRCTRCGKTHDAPMPPQVTRCGLIGPNLTAMVAYLKGVCHASFSTIRKFLRDVMHVIVSRGQWVKLIGKVSAALAEPYQHLLERLPDEDRLNVDETGHKDNGRTMWTWCFRAELFKIDPSRGSHVLVEVLGREFNGVLGCDYFSAYRKYMKDGDVAVQFCLAHLIREVKFLTTLTDPVTRRYGQRLLEALRRLFGVIHHRDRLSPTRFDQAMEQARKHMLKIGRRAPSRPEARNLAERFRKHGDAYFQFITTPGLEPTNNLAEQAIRFIVIDRRITQGTRSQAGRRWNERIWTTIATLTQQGRSVLAYLRDAFNAAIHHQPIPALLPAGP